MSDGDVLAQIYIIERGRLVTDDGTEIISHETDCTVKGLTQEDLVGVLEDFCRQVRQDIEDARMNS